MLEMADVFSLGFFLRTKVAEKSSKSNQRKKGIAAALGKISENFSIIQPRFSNSSSSFLQFSSPSSTNIPILRHLCLYLSQYVVCKNDPTGSKDSCCPSINF